MKFVPAIDLIHAAAADGYAIPSFCAWNAETMAAVLQVASDCRAPVMLMNGPAELAVLSPARMAVAARGVAADFNVPAALHLDHGNSLECVRRCLDAGYSSVMLDFSTRPLGENISAMRQVMALARPGNVTVEGEIGAVGRVDSVSAEGPKASTLTRPDEARTFVSETGIDMVAVSIGNAHGAYTTLPTFDFELLGKLREVTGIPLVLHGGSGTPAEDIRRAIGLGIAKINIATDLVRAFRETLLTRWRANQTLWAPLALADAVKAMAPAIERWIRLCGAAGRA